MESNIMLMFSSQNSKLKERTMWTAKFFYYRSKEPDHLPGISVRFIFLNNNILFAELLSQGLDSDPGIQFSYFDNDL